MRWICGVGLMLVLLAPLARTEAPQARDRGLAATEVRRGVFLVAVPALSDPNFSQTVVLVTQHGPGGTMGVVINRPTGKPLSAVLPDVKSFAGRDDRLWSGGPVRHDELVVLFRSDRAFDPVLPVFADLYLTQSLKVLEQLLASNAGALRLYAGYAGWAPGQLRNEIARGDWRIIPAEPALVFQSNTEALWEEMLARSEQQMI
jgi:putative transcriptional regulator